MTQPLAVRPKRAWWFAFAPLAALVATLLLADVLIRRSEEGKEKAQKIPGIDSFAQPRGVQALAVQGDVVWVGGKEGVAALDRNSGAILRKLDCGAPLDYVRALLLDHEGILWIGHQAGLSRFDGRACTSLSAKDGLPDGRVNALWLDRDRQLWAGTWKGAAMRQGKGWRILTRADGLADDMVSVIFQDRRGGMWFGSTVAPGGGLTQCEGGLCRVFTTREGLPHNSINAIAEDGDGNVWAGAGFFDRGGAARFRRQGDEWRLAEVLLQKDGLAGAKVRSLYLDRRGVLNFGSEYDGMARRERAGWRVLKAANGLAGEEVTTMAEDGQGDLWLGGPDGVTRIRSETLMKWR